MTIVTRQTTLLLSASGAEPRELVRGLDRLGLLPETAEKLEVDYEKRPPGTGWIGTWLPKARALQAMTNDGHTLTFDAGGVVTLQRPNTDIAVPALFEALQSLPFELAVVGQVYPEWWDEEYVSYSFSDGHVPHGWACAFRGSGYDRLVSRRWLDFGPWRKRPVADATWIEFHDLDADPKSALEHAQPGWKRMGISDVGGFIQRPFFYKDDVRGVYDPNERKLKVMVPSGTVSERKMLEIAAARRDTKIQNDRPFEHTAFVFLDEANARRHLHELWLRDHECWAIIDGQEHRLDADYHPDPVAKPG